jgi:hypothetical protein
MTRVMMLVATNEIALLCLKSQPDSWLQECDSFGMGCETYDAGWIVGCIDVAGNTQSQAFILMG